MSLVTLLMNFSKFFNIHPFIIAVPAKTLECFFTIKPPFFRNPQARVKNIKIDSNLNMWRSHLSIVNLIDKKLSTTTWAFKANHEILTSLVLKIIVLEFHHCFFRLLHQCLQIFKLWVNMPFDCLQLFFHIIQNWVVNSVTSKFVLKLIPMVRDCIVITHLCFPLGVIFHYLRNFSINYCQRLIVVVSLTVIFNTRKALTVILKLQIMFWS